MRFRTRGAWRAEQSAARWRKEPASERVVLANPAPCLPYTGKCVCVQGGIKGPALGRKNAEKGVSTIVGCHYEPLSSLVHGPSLSG